ncbi:hypothetical protein EDD11_006575 [Mortierella claussenii]|nr:hypothetical protein EDD11_006575 [Mortierella claussenii]
MPATVDIKSAVEICDILCMFALHFASQDLSDGQADPEEPERPLDEHHRANLQTIRNLNSTILTGVQASPAVPSSGVHEPGSDDRTGHGEAQGSSDATMDSEADTHVDKEGGSGVRFREGPPSDEMVHELAKAATSVFQLAIRIKAWVGMTPEERELDEEINIIRGKRCLFMDGSTMIPLPSWDVHNQQRPAHQLQRYGYPGYPLRDQESLLAASQFQSTGEGGSQYTQHSGPYKSTASLQDGMAATSATVYAESSLMRSKSTTSIKSVPSDRNDSPHQKYRKRAKRTHPPGRCLSCDSSDTPEWRRGPDGARTLCNACGLHYAKLLKRQNKQAASNWWSNKQSSKCPEARFLKPTSNY